MSGTLIALFLSEFYIPAKFPGWIISAKDFTIIIGQVVFTTLSFTKQPEFRR